MSTANGLRDVIERDWFKATSAADLLGYARTVIQFAQVDHLTIRMKIVRPEDRPAMQPPVR